jgi:micrococcal nuclease
MNPGCEGSARSPWACVTTPVVAGLAVAALMLAVLSGCSCASTTEAPPQETGATALGIPVVTEPGGTGPVSPIQVTLLRVVDGDTIRVRMPDGMEERVRYIGIDAPEVAHSDADAEYLGDEATDRNARLLDSESLDLELDVEERDPYGRLLAYVWAGGLLVNEQLVLDGYARARDYPPNLRRQPQLREAERKARAAEVGLWAPRSPPTSAPK